MADIIRPAAIGDAAAVSDLINALDIHEGNPGLAFTPEIVAAHMFGPQAHCSLLVAERDGQVAGYLLHFPGYDTDRAAPNLVVADLFVYDHARSGRLGEKLLAAAAQLAQDRGYVSLTLRVRSTNLAARRFYDRLAAKDKQSDVLEWYGASLASLADRRD